ncbi:hypothetical protein C3L33_17925, partial [Rhododendron williamsianum]
MMRGYVFYGLHVPVSVLFRVATGCSQLEFLLSVGEISQADIFAAILGKLVSFHVAREDKVFAGKNIGTEIPSCSS